MCNVNLRPVACITQLGSFFRINVDSGDKELIETTSTVFRKLDQYIQNDFFLGALLRKGLALQSTYMIEEACQSSNNFRGRTTS